MKKKLDELRKEFTIMETLSLSPNYAYLSKKYGMDYRTIKKYHEGYAGKPMHHNKGSTLDKYLDIIKDKLNYNGVKISSLYFFLKEEKDYKGSYSNLTYYIRKNNLFKKKKQNIPTPRYETDIGEQIQFDWVENITMINKNGEEINFNVFSAELSYSRFHYFCYSKTKTREDVMISLVNAFKFFGGIAKSILTDNMSSIVDTNNLKFCDEFKAFAKDMGFELNKCKVRHANTKGKVEVRNKFIKWLIPYNNDFEKEDELKDIIKRINNEANNIVNSSTGLKPILLYQKEKEYLNPLPNNNILETYMNFTISQTVPSTSLISYKGNEYSVPIKYINQTLKMKELDNKLYIYNNTELVEIHKLSHKKINYSSKDYTEALKATMPNKSDNDIEQLAKKNLKLFENIGNLKEEG